MTLLQSIIVSIGLIHGLVLWLTAMPASVILKSMVYDRMSRCRDSRASRSRLIDPILLLQGYEKHMAPVIMLFFQILCGILVVKQLIGRYFGASSAQQLGKYCSLYMGRQCHVFLKVWKEQLSNVDCAWILADMLIVSAMQYYCRVLSCHVNDTEAPQVEGKNTQDRTYRTNLIDMWRQAELQILQKEDMKWKPPPMALTRALVAPLFWLWRPCVVGLDEAIHDLGIGEPSNEGGLSLSSSPSKPINSITGNIWSTFSAKRIREPYSSHCPTPAKILIVSNHAILGLEMPLLYQIWYERTGKFLRGLADHLHFYAPWKKCVQYFGAIHGSRQNVDALMAQGLSPLLVYPGGMREIWKQSRDENYSMHWSKRIGFVRLALKHGYTIIPCASVGTEDQVGILADVPMGWYRPGITHPVPFLNLSRWQRVYLWFGKPMSPDTWTRGGRVPCTDDDFLKIQRMVHEQVQKGIDTLKHVQESDPDRFTWRHRSSV